MAYEEKPNTFVLFKNEKKTKDSHPDYRGEGIDANGEPVWVSVWVNRSQNGRMYMKGQQKPKDDSDQRRHDEGGAQVDDDDVPF